MKIKMIFLGFIVSFVVSSCFNMTKEQYLSEYKGFVQQIKDNQQGYITEDWVKMDKIHYRYSEELFKKYEKDFTVEEKVILAKYRLQYDVYRYKDEAKEALLDVFDLYYAIQNEVNNQNIDFLLGRKDELKKIIDDYMVNGLNEDTNFLIEQTKRAKSVFSRFLTEIGLGDTIIQDN